MKILIVGGGGREHAIAWKLAQSPRVEKLYCAPGNAGIAQVAECVNIGVMEFDKLTAFAKEHAIDLTVVAPDDPLAAGAVDAFEAAGLRAFGPRANAAILEGSKAFSKDLMKKYGIPTAAYETFSDPEQALAYLETAKMPIVLKADGLALGKGVLICQNLDEGGRPGIGEGGFNLSEPGRSKNRSKNPDDGQAVWLCRGRDCGRRIYDWTRSIGAFLCGWKDHQDHDLRSGSQACQGRRPGP